VVPPFRSHHHHVHQQQFHPAYYQQPIIQWMSAALLASIAAPEKPSVLLQAVVTLGEKTADGHIIVGVAPAWAEIIRLMEEDPEILFKIDPRKLEEMIAGAYEKAGFDEVILTRRSGDHGRDVIASRKDWGQVRFIDQVKAYKPKHLVTAEEVRALGFVLTSDQNATKGFVTTTSDFAPKIAEDPFIKPHLPYRIELVNGVELARRLVELAKEE
jgi:restriction system protein